MSPDIINATALFASTLVLVYALGMQSLNVNNGRIAAAAMTSFLIGAAHLVCYKLVPGASVIEMAAFLLGGPVGIVLAMVTHPNRKRK